MLDHNDLGCSTYGMGWETKCKLQCTTAARQVTREGYRLFLQTDGMGSIEIQQAKDGRLPVPRRRRGKSTGQHGRTRSRTWFAPQTRLLVQSMKPAYVGTAISKSDAA